MLRYELYSESEKILGELDINMEWLATHSCTVAGAHTFCGETWLLATELDDKRQVMRGDTFRLSYDNNTLLMSMLESFGEMIEKIERKDYPKIHECLTLFSQTSLLNQLQK